MSKLAPVRRLFLFWFSVAFTTAVSANVLAAEPTTAERALRLSEEAVELYKAHDYRRAIEKYAGAYTLDPDPNLIFNQGRCYEALGDRPAAAEKYKEFLARPNGDINARKKASEYVARFEAGDTRDEKPTTSAPIPSRAERVEATPTNNGATMRTVGLGLAGVGVVSAAVGTYFFFSGRSDIQDVKDMPGYGQAGTNAGAVAPLSESEAQSKIDDGKSRQTLGGVLLGAGAGAAVLGAGLFFFAPKPAKPTAPTAALGGWALPGGGALTLQGRF